MEKDFEAIFCLSHNFSSASQHHYIVTAHGLNVSITYITRWKGVKMLMFHDFYYDRPPNKSHLLWASSFKTYTIIQTLIIIASCRDDGFRLFSIFNSSWLKITKEFLRIDLIIII